jgi:hypothetical protein
MVLNLQALTADKGDSAWMRVSTILVLMMTLPGLGLFYGGLVSTNRRLAGHGDRHRPGFVGARCAGLFDRRPVPRPAGGRGDRHPLVRGGSALVFWLVKRIIGLRGERDQEREGLDLADHDERAYNY